MSKQITIRLDDDLVAFMDEQVAAHAEGATSRAAVVTRAMQREWRRVLAARDAAILADHPDAELDKLAAHAGRTPLEID
jgi:antitoxin MazE3